MSEFTFNPAEVEVTKKTYDPIPPGTYLVMITSAAVKSSRSGEGRYLLIVYSLKNNPEYNGRKVFERFFFQGTSEESMRISREQLKNLCVAIGLGNSVIDNPSMFIGYSLAIKIIIDEAKSGYKADNKVVSHYPY